MKSKRIVVIGVLALGLLPGCEPVKEKKDAVGLLGTVLAKTKKTLHERPPHTAEEYRERYGEAPPESIWVTSENRSYTYINGIRHYLRPDQAMWYPGDPEINNEILGNRQQGSNPSDGRGEDNPDVGSNHDR